MSAPKSPVCITCGQAVSEPPTLQLLAGGQPCPACADRVLEAQPSLLAGPSPRPEHSMGSGLHLVTPEGGAEIGPEDAPA